MSEAPRRRIRAQPSAQDGDVMGFVLDQPIIEGGKVMLRAGDDTPLSKALFGVAGVTDATVAQATIWIRKAPTTDWVTLKPEIATAIRTALDTADAPLGGQADPRDDPDAALLRAVEDLLDRQVNPSVAAHGGHIAVEKVADSRVYLRMSGGCQGCAASSATLREGVERMLRAALPEITEIVDVTDHAAGTTPFYAKADGPSPMLNRPLPPGVIDWQDGQIMIDPDYLAPRLGLTSESLRAGLRNGDVVGVTETGEDTDAGKTRIIMRSATRSWAAEIDASGAAREIPPPRMAVTGTQQERDLAARVRAHLAALPPQAVPVTYGALARALGLWAPGSIRKVTRALEITMREDAAQNRPFIAARAVSRGRDGLPGEGFFSFARSVGRGPDAGESDQAFHAREIAQLGQTAA
ncbi:MAG: NifU family protein [Rhodobacteraceae bacterium]|nr:NifU family protein [Paracoccaceae bacterium]